MNDEQLTMNPADYVKLKTTDMPQKKDDKPSSIILRKIPADIWEKICKEKREILLRNPSRGNVSHYEAIYRLMRKECE
jgi:hypothetical protein